MLRIYEAAVSETVFISNVVLWIVAGRVSPHCFIIKRHRLYLSFTSNSSLCSMMMLYDELVG